MKNTTTGAPDDVFTVEPFIRNQDSRFVGPVLLTLPKSATKKPALHEVEVQDDGTFSHRFVWRDGVACMVRSRSMRIAGPMALILYQESRLACEEIEYMHHGSEMH